MSDELSTGLAATANESTHDTQPTTPDAVLDAAFAPSAEGSDPSDTSTQSDPAKEATAGAIAQPQANAAPKAQAEGAPPPEKWEHVLANARTKAREEALAEYRDPATGRDLLTVAKLLHSDLPGTLSQLLEEAASNEQWADAVTAKAAAILSARRQRGKVDEEPQPDAVMRYEDGTTEPTYTPQQWKKVLEYRERQMKASLMNEFKPLQELSQQFTTFKQRAQDEQQAASIAEQRGAVWKDAPMFAENKDAILKRQAELYAEAQTQQGFDPVNGPWELLQRAYFDVVRTQALPKQQAQQTQAQIASAAHKRAGSSSDPAAAAPAQPRKPRTPDEALDQVFNAYVGAR